MRQKFFCISLSPIIFLLVQIDDVDTLILVNTPDVDVHIGRDLGDLGTVGTAPSRCLAAVELVVLAHVAVVLVAVATTWTRITREGMPVSLETGYSRLTHGITKVEACKQDRDQSSLVSAKCRADCGGVWVILVGLMCGKVMLIFYATIACMLTQSVCDSWDTKCWTLFCYVFQYHHDISEIICSLARSYIVESDWGQLTLICETSISTLQYFEKYYIYTKLSTTCTKVVICKII